MRDMMEGRIVFQKYDNDRYTNLKWTSVKQFLINEKVNIGPTNEDTKKQ
jgi:hypothetical protein